MSVEGIFFVWLVQRLLTHTGLKNLSFREPPKIRTRLILHVLLVPLFPPLLNLIWWYCHFLVVLVLLEVLVDLIFPSMLSSSNERLE